jgi:hypothetical protein
MRKSSSGTALEVRLQWRGVALPTGDLLVAAPKSVAVGQVVAQLHDVRIHAVLILQVDHLTEFRDERRERAFPRALKEGATGV